MVKLCWIEKQIEIFGKCAKQEILMNRYVKKMISKSNHQDAEASEDLRNNVQSIFQITRPRQDEEEKQTKFAYIKEKRRRTLDYHVSWTCNS